MKERNTILSLFFIFITIAYLISLYIPRSFASGDNVVIIPDEAIRLRILANSNSEKDQAVKRKVRDEVNKEITKWVKDLTSIDEARKTIVDHLPLIENIAEKVLEKENLSQNVQIEFNEVYFPTKLYGEFLYPAGEYEAILITIGEGKGANWWCVLFPPLCFLDFSNGTAVSTDTEDHKESKKLSKKDTKNQSLYVEEEEDEVEVKFFIVEMFEKIWEFLF